MEQLDRARMGNHLPCAVDRCASSGTHDPFCHFPWKIVGLSPSEALRTLDPPRTLAQSQDPGPFPAHGPSPGPWTLPRTLDPPQDPGPSPGPWTLPRTLDPPQDPPQDPGPSPGPCTFPGPPRGPWTLPRTLDPPQDPPPGRVPSPARFLTCRDGSDLPCTSRSSMLRGIRSDESQRRWLR